ncbi:hypothetical protein [Methanobrevibacter sp.]
MIELEDKYVFHIPLYKYKDDELVVIEMDGLLDNLISELADKGFDSFYMAEVKSFYKSRIYDEILITVFSPKDKSPLEIFKKWFRKNNHILFQEAFAFEIGDKMIVEKF